MLLLTEVVAAIIIIITVTVVSLVIITRQVFYFIFGESIFSVLYLIVAPLLGLKKSTYLRISV